jgi:outer membrane protein assembly factor BamB
MLWNQLIACCSALLVVVLPSLARAQLKAGPGDWPGWRGADRTGVSPETGLLKKWPPDGPKLLWTSKGLGIGYSTPSVAGGRVFLLGGKENEEYVLALDVKDGRQLWATKIGLVGKNLIVNYPGPRCTPTVDGDRLYVLGSDGDLACLAVDGKVLWQKNMAKDFEGKRGSWAYAESPLLDGDFLVVTPGGPTNSLVALHKKTGDLIWKTPLPDMGEAAYSSAIVAEVGGVRQYVQILRRGMVGVAAKDGQLLWSYDKLAGNTICVTPIFHNGCVFESVGGNGEKLGCALLRLSAEGRQVSASEVYNLKTLPNHHGGIVRVGDCLYGTTNNALVCLDFLTGEKKWEDRSVGKGSVSAADGHLYVRAERDGQVALVEATPAGYKEQGRLKQPERSKFMAWPHPVIAGGCLYLRDDDILLCYDIKAK